MKVKNKMLYLVKDGTNLARGVLKAIISFFLIVGLMLNKGVVYSASQDNYPVRVINIVYDDSGSMIVTGGKEVDTWCQAKYSMEVFAAMLGEKDTMNIYVMSDYVRGTTAPPRLTLHGQEGAETNVAKIHNMVTSASDTPFNSVRKAYSDLCEVEADEKWLVVLTDGVFQGIDDIDGYFATKASDVNVMFLGMGSEAAEISADESNHVYFEKAETTKQILNKITNICTRIFNSNKLSVDVESSSFSFDIPMAELTVFVQGANVKMDGLVSQEGADIVNQGNVVDVRYSEVATTNKRYSNPRIDTGLVGQVVTYRGDFSPGEYLVNVSGAETIEVYYKPNVEIMAYLIDEEGKEVESTAGIEAGDYTLEFGFVRAGTLERVNESSLLGDITYTAQITLNEAGDGLSYTSGDIVHLQEGKCVINAYADYLEYNSLETELQFDVFRNKELFFEIEQSPEYLVSRNSIDNKAEPMVVHITLEGAEFTEEQWNMLELPSVSQTTKTDKRIQFIIEKTSEPGIVHIFPELKDGKTSIGDYSDIGINIALRHKEKLEVWKGEIDGELQITDLRSWIERHLDKVIKIAILLGIILLILGYVPGIKKYLPKKLKKAPRIECESNVGMRRTWEVKGRCTKNRISTLLPYVAETATIRFLPRGVSGVSALKVKAIGSNRMEITNTKAYAGKKNISFDGTVVEDKVKKNLKKTAGMRVKYETRDADYTCVLNK